MARPVFIFLLLAIAAACTHAVPQRPPQPAISVTLTPLAEDGSVTGLRVVQTVEGYSSPPGEVLFTVPSRIAFTPGQRYEDGAIEASDGAGPLPLSMGAIPAPAGHPLELQTFSPDRQTIGAVTLRYTARITPSMAPRIPGPSYDLRGTDGGFGGAFFSFLLLPAGAEGKTGFSLNWDFSFLPADSRGVTTAGRNIEDEPLDPMEIYLTFLLGGNIHGHAREDRKLQMFWIGDPPFDPYTMADWTATAFDALQSFFEDEDAGDYTLLMRPFALPRDGGGATRGGFMLEYGTGHLSDAARRIMFAHEMIHHFVPSLDGFSSADAWYGEGLAEFYKIKAALNAGLIGAEDAAAEIAVMTNAYYSSAYVDMPFEEAAALRWADRSIQSVPYNRGFMYFADLNARIVSASAGSRSLDDLVRAMLARQRAGLSYDEAAWRELLEAELGAAGLAGLDDMLQGKLIVPAEDAFGPCFTRARSDTNRRVLGFEENSVLVRPRIVSGLQPDSPAALAGLRNGDTIVSFTGITERIAHSAPNVLLAEEISLTLQRDGDETPFPISFPATGPEMTEYRWDLVTGAGEPCTLP